MRVTITRGLIDKAYQQFKFLDDTTEQFMTVVNGDNYTPWQGFWRATGEPIELPNVNSIKKIRGFSENGQMTATIEVENVIFKAITGIGGIYHAMKRGYLSPWLGAQLIGRVDAGEQNEWYEVLDNGYRIDIYQGYGDQREHTFAGLIEDVDLETHPERITITSRCYGVLFTDQRVMGDNKPPEIPAPMTVADRELTLGIKPVGSSPHASSTAKGRHVASIVKPGKKTDWVSEGHTEASDAEHVEITLPPGYYEDIYLSLPYNGQSIYISIFAGAGSHFNGEPVTGWVPSELGNTPGADSQPYTNRWGSSSAIALRRSLGGPLQATTGTRIRVTLSKLPYRSEWHSRRAGVTRLAGMLFGTDSEHPLNGRPGVKSNHWVLIDDLTDMVKAVFMWAGFHEWETEDIGWSLEHPMIWSMDKFFIDMLTAAQDQANWLFYMTSPSSSSESLGVPCFVHNRATDPPPPGGLLEIRDQDMLEAVEPKFDLSNLPYIIRYRGDVDTENGVVYDGDLVKRYNAAYFPPWSGAGPNITESGRNAGVRRHELTVDTNLKSDEQCMFAAILAALQYALQFATAQIQIPGYPGIELNEQISIVSGVTGINSRMWVASVSDEQTGGPSGTWEMTVGGSLIDNVDMEQIRKDLAEQEQIVVDQRRLKASP